MINIVSSALIYRPIKQVFDFISDSENDFLWQYGILDSSHLPNGAIGGLGSFFRTVGHLLGRRNLSAFEVTEYDPGRKYGFKSVSGPLNLHTLYTFETVKGCTRLDVATKVSATDPLLVQEGALEKRLKKQLRENLAMLKELLETK